MMNFSRILICCTIACLCSCKSKKVVTDYYEKTIVNSELSSYHHQADIDTTRTACMDILSQVLTIEETIKVTEYDAESGKPIKETETKRKVAQDTDKVVSEEKAKGVRTEQNDSLKHKEDTATNVETETKEETKGGQEAFGKWLGIVVGFGIVVLIIYLCKKF